MGQAVVTLAGDDFYKRRAQIVNAMLEACVKSGDDDLQCVGICSLRAVAAVCANTAVARERDMLEGRQP